MNKPQVLHLDVVKQMFRYLKCTIDHGIFFQKKESKKIKVLQTLIGQVIKRVGDHDQCLDICFSLGTVPSHGVINVN
jgi:hypothetical protein